MNKNTLFTGDSESEGCVVVCNRMDLTKLFFLITPSEKKANSDIHSSENTRPFLLDTEMFLFKDLVEY